MRIKLKGGDEYDALTKAKKFYHWKSGERKRIKPGYNKRLRKCVYDGGEFRNRLTQEIMWSCPDVSSVNANNNDNRKS